MIASARERKVLVMAVMILLTLSDRHLGATAESDLEVLEEVRDALNHAEESLNALSDLVTGIVSTEETDTTTELMTTNNPTTTTTATSTTSASPITSTTPPPPTTATLSPTSTTLPTTTTTTTIPLTTTTNTPSTTTTSTTSTTSTTTTSTTSTTSTTTTTTTTTTSTMPITTTSTMPITTTSTKPTTTSTMLTTITSTKPTTTTSTKSTTTTSTKPTTTTSTKPTTTTSTTATPTLSTSSSSSTREFTGVGFMMDTVTLDPWWMRVNMRLGAMKNVTAAIGGGNVDLDHAHQLEEEADAMDDLVDEGTEDPSLVTVGELDYELFQSVESNLKNSSDLVNKLISDAKADNVELVVTIVMLSLLFVVVLTGLIIALIRPWAKRSGLKPKRSQRAEGHVVAKDEAQNFPDAKFVQHMHIHMDPYRTHDTKI